jgi:hypothetical protein
MPLQPFSLPLFFSCFLQAGVLLQRIGQMPDSQAPANLVSVSAILAFVFVIAAQLRRIHKQISRAQSKHAQTVRKAHSKALRKRSLPPSHG